jgi:hypothetical protein
VGRRGTLGVRARRKDSPEIAGSRCAAGDAGEEERKVKGGADRWGRVIREKEGERARGGGGPAGEKKRELAGLREWAACGRRKGEWAAGEKRPRRVGLLGWFALFQTLSYLLF